MEASEAEIAARIAELDADIGSWLQARKDLGNGPLEILDFINDEIERFRHERAELVGILSEKAG